MSETILFDVDGRMAVVTLNRPGRLNAVNGTMMVALLETVEALSDDRDIPAVVLTGARADGPKGLNASGQKSGSAYVGLDGQRERVAR